jgi:hypothetical protein
LSVNFSIHSQWFLYQVVRYLYLYTEKFWTQDTVPYVAIKFQTENNMIPIDLFVPDGEYAAESIQPTEITSDYLVWVVNDYVPRKQMYIGREHLIHPEAIRGSQICDMFTQITGVDVQCK